MDDAPGAEDVPTPLKVREFLYVDVQRTRSLLAQMDRGVLELTREKWSATKEGALEGRLFGIGASGRTARASDTEESRSLQDLTFVTFEETAESEGVIQDLGDEYRDSAAWESGWVHDELSEGQIVRIRSDVELLDAAWFEERLRRFDTMVGALVRIGVEGVKPQGHHPNQKLKPAQIDAMKRQFFGGELSPDQLQAIGEFISAFMGDAISLRVLPCGKDKPELGFAGALLGRTEYIQEEREHLYGTYGSELRSWTVVLQIAAVRRKAAELDPDFSTPIDETGSISRAQTERMARTLSSMLEAYGIVGGPRYPTISVVPLAVYRELP